MNYSVLDVETTGATNDTIGNPFTRANRLCYIGVWNGDYNDWSIEYDQSPYGNKLQESFGVLEKSELLVGFNIKFDLHWLRRYGFHLGSQNLWDCQLAYFIMTGQKHPYPSLNDVAAHYGLGQKIDVVKEEYWNKGIDTDQVPKEILREYLQQDVLLTQQIFELQRDELKQNLQLKRCVWYNCQDLKTTLEMESNGLKYDLEKSMERGNELQERIVELDSNLNGLYPDLPINWNSDRHLSAILYGGSISFDQREKYLFTYKDGSEKWKERWGINEVSFPQLVSPIKGTELKAEGVWSVAEGILQKLRISGRAKQIVECILERSGIETKRNRYYHGFPKLYSQMDWSDSIIHTNLNHVVAQTGRLSSNKPNVQNLEEGMRECVVTRF